MNSLKVLFTTLFTVAVFAISTIGFSQNSISGNVWDLVAERLSSTNAIAIAVFNRESNEAMCGKGFGHTGGGGCHNVLETAAAKFQPEVNEAMCGKGFEHTGGGVCLSKSSVSQVIWDLVAERLSSTNAIAIAVFNRESNEAMCGKGFGHTGGGGCYNVLETAAAKFQAEVNEAMFF